MEYIKEPQ